MATMSPGLCAGQGVQFTARPLLRTRDNLTPSRERILSKHGSFRADSARSLDSQLGDAKLSSIEIEAFLREKVRSRFQELQQGFQNYDIDRNLSVTRGEFRRVLQAFCFPLSTEQFETILAKIERNNNGTVKYCDFLDKFYGRNISSNNCSADKAQATKTRFLYQPSPHELNVDVLEKMIKEKIKRQLKNFVKALQLFDYNRDGKVQRHELRRVLENYCFRFTDQQFDKIWQRYDFHHNGVVDYQEFLKRLGVNVLNAGLPPPNNAKGALLWTPAEKKSPEERKYRAVQTSSVLKGLNLDQIEAEFRKLMKQHMNNITRACIAMDKHLDGFLSIEGIKAILDQFTVHMSDQLFTDLMNRCGVNATGKVKWEAFLAKFQSPLAPSNGQTLPIKPSHKWFPVNGGTEVLPAADIWTLLYKHVHEAYPSIKAAFLEFDVNRDGIMSRGDLRQILDKFTWRMSDEQFKELMVIIDPQHTNKISYHKFLELFEERESKEGHKWLKSSYYFNKDPKPAVLAWETIEKLLRDKIVENWKVISEAIVRLDPKAEYLIIPGPLKRILDKHALLISNDHFNSLVEKLEHKIDGKINYAEFFDNLDVTVLPGDLAGLSTQIFQGNLESQLIHLDDQHTRHNRIDCRVADHTNLMSADEVIVRLKDRMSQHNIQMRKSFLSFVKNRRGLIHRKDFREVLSSFGMYMSEDQFKELITRLGFVKGVMNYTDFLQHFDDPRIGGPASDVQRANNHHVNAIRGDQFGMTALEAESKLRSKLRENFQNLRGAFYKFDEDHNGILTKENFRRLLDAFMIFMENPEFDQLCSRLGVDKNTKISYKDFLQRFEVKDTKDGHKWLNSTHHYNSVKQPRDMTAEEVHQVLADRAHRAWKDLAIAFLDMDKDGNGVITKNELELILYKFVISMSGEEFEKLWRTFDTQGKGYVTHQQFLKSVGAINYAPSDETGVSRRIIEQSARYLDDHNAEQQVKQERITLNQACRAIFFNAEDVLQQLKDKVRDHYADLYTAFRKYDTRKRGFLSVAEIQKVLIDLNYFLDDEQFFRLLDKLGLKTHKSKLSYGQFLRAFEEGHKSNYGKQEAQVAILELTSLSPEDADAKLRAKVTNQYDVLTKAFAAFDKEQAGRIPIADFRKILDVFCFRLTDQQFQFIITKMDVKSENMILYQVFMDQNTGSTQGDPDKWLSTIQNLSQAHASQPVPYEELLEQLKESVRAHSATLIQEFSEIDYAKIGVIAKGDFRDILTRNIFRMTDEQFEKLWSGLAVNEFGNLMYTDFLKQCGVASMDASHNCAIEGGSPDQALAGDITTRRPGTSMSVRSMTQIQALQRPSTMQSRSDSRMHTPFVNAQPIERQLKDKIFQHWQNIQKQCRTNDPENTGQIGIHLFRDIIQSYGIEIGTEAFQKLMQKYDINENGRLSYVHFLRHFILNLKSRENSNLLQLRSRQRPAEMKIDPVVLSDPFFDAMMRVRECVLRNWKDMRRMFRNIDCNATSFVTTVDFRKVLKTFNMDLTEEEFFHIMTYYDKKLNGQISYNDFIKTYLK